MSRIVIVILRYHRLKPMYLVNMSSYPHLHYYSVFTYYIKLKLMLEIPMRSLDFFSLPNPSSRTVVLGSTQPLTEMSTRDLPGG
jgi:hypothetical protein